MQGVIVSSEDIATTLGLAAADLLIEQQVVDQPTGPPLTQPRVEAIAALTDQIVGGESVTLPSAFVAGVQPIEQIAVLTDLRDKVAELWKEFGEWRKKVLSPAGDKLHEIANKVLEMAKKLGVSAEHLLARLQRRITAFMVQNTATGPFSVGSGPDRVVFRPAELSVTSTAKSAPSLGSMDVAGVVTALAGILSMELSVDVKYEVKS